MSTDTSGGAEGMVHTASFRLNSVLFVLFLGLSVVLWLDMPDRYPVHFGTGGTPTRWAEGPGMWILLVAVCSISFGKLHLFQRFLFSDPHAPLINVPYKKRFQDLPTARKVPVIRRVNRMLGAVNAAMLLLFMAILVLIHHAAHNPDSPATGAASRALLGVVLLVVAVPVLEAAALRRMIRRKLLEEGLLP